MEVEMWNSPSHVRYLLSNDIAGARFFGAALGSIPSTDREAWCDRVLLGTGLSEGGIPDDGPELPRGCTPYLPCPVDRLLTALGTLQLHPEDVLVDIGSGIGRAAILAHFLTGASVLGIEIQRDLVEQARRVALELGRSRVSTVHADAEEMMKYLPIGTAYLLYCPFGDNRVTAVFRELERVSWTRKIRVACIDMQEPSLPWLQSIGAEHHSVRTYESVSRFSSNTWA